MKIFPLIFLFPLITLLTNCNSNSVNTSESRFITGKNDSINIYAFIGKKISVDEFDPNINNEIIENGIDEESGDSIKIVRKSYTMDNAFRCKYKVIKGLFNNLEDDTIEFIAYDHYGNPAFAKNDTVVLYLSKNKLQGHFYHQKYQYDNVFKDKDGNYFSYPKFNGIEDVKYANENLKGFKINLKEVKHNLSNLSEESIENYYPKQFYKIENNFAYPKTGIDLFQLISYRLNTTFKDL